MKTSVILTTYNGEKYLRQQLDSIIYQTVKVDEIIIADDQSTDTTIEVLKSYENHPNLSYYINENNLGHNLNFLMAAKKAKGDIIFFCDQDDIWDNQKVEKMVSIFQKNEKINVLSSLKHQIDENGIIKKSIIFNKTKFSFNKIEKINFSKFIYEHQSSGNTLGIKKEFFDKYIDYIIENNLPFDLSFGYLSAATKSFYRINEKLIFYRIHTNNTSNTQSSLKGKLNSYNRHLKGREYKQSIIHTVEPLLNSTLDVKTLKQLKKYLNHLQDEIDALRKKEVRKLIKYIFSLNSMINKKLVFFDMLIIFKIRGAK